MKIKLIVSPGSHGTKKSSLCFILKKNTIIAFENDFRYMGTPLKIDDQRLSEYSKWLKKHNIVIVKLDSCQRTNSGAEDVYPSFVAISWHGPDYEIALRQRNQICEEFFSFLSLLRKNNWFVPILIGGDFNIDLKSFNFDNHTDYL